MTPEQDDEPCDYCGGEGHIDVDRARRGHDHYTERMPCPECSVDGDLDEDEREPNPPNEDTSGPQEPWL